MFPRKQNSERPHLLQRLYSGDCSRAAAGREKVEARREESRHRVVHCPFDHSAVSLQPSWLLSHGRAARGEEPLSLRTALGWADRPTIYLLSSFWLLPLSGQDHTPLYFWAVFWSPPTSMEDIQNSCEFR